MIKHVHGGDVYSREIDLDFSANINPLGMPDSVKAAIINSVLEFEKYPDVRCKKLKSAIAEFENVGVDNIVCGNGAADLIYKIVGALKPKRALVPSPTFSEYEKALETFDCEVLYHCLSEENDFKIDERIISKIKGIDMLFLCNPNNPVGNLTDPAIMKKIINKCIEQNVTFVIDECFLDFVENKELYSVKPEFDNVVIIKAFTKIFAMAGVRLGYMICKDKYVCEKAESFGQCWNVSAVAQTAGCAALGEKEYILKTVEAVKKEREFLTENLRKLNFKVFEPCANFIFFKTSLPIDRWLLEDKIAVRSCGNYKNLNENFFRIAVRTHAENEALIIALLKIQRTKGY